MINDNSEYPPKGEYYTDTGNSKSNKIRKPEREVCVHKDADNEPDCCDCFFHNRLCDEWEAYIKQSDHKRLTKLFDEYKRDYRITMKEVNKAFTKQMIEECTGSDDRLNYEIGREIVEHQPAYKIVYLVKKAIRNAMLKRL